MVTQLVWQTRLGAIGAAAVAAVLFSACSGEILSRGDAETAAQAALSKTSWVPCAKQGQQCAFTAERRVRYGVENQRATIKKFTNGVKCDGAVFGVRTRRTAKCQFENIATVSGGAGGSGAAGTDPRAGSSGSASAGSVAPPAAGTRSMSVTSALHVDRTNVRPGETLTGTVTYTNTTGSALTIWTMTISARAPGATHTGGPFSDLTPSGPLATVAVGESVTLTASRTFSAADALGTWEAYSTYQGDDNVWRDGPSVFFEVGAGAKPEPVATPVPVPTPVPVATPVPVPTPVPTGTGTMQIGTNFWYHTANEDNWSGETSLKSGINWATAYGSGSNGLAATNIWDATFISELAPYTVLRFMDWGNVNHSHITSWSQRMLATDPKNAAVYIDSLSPANNPGMAYEWMIDLGNRTGKDIWICLPAKSDAGYWTQLAALIKNKLQPGRKVYVEYSNETWNGSFGQFQYTLDQGVAQGLPGSNEWYQGQSFAVSQSLKIFKAFEDVMGASAMGSRVIRVFAYGGNMDTGRQALQSVYMSSKWNPSNQKIDMLAMAPYIGSGLDGASSNIQAAFHDEIDEMEVGDSNGTIGRVAFAVEDLRSFGIAQLGAYEGGQHLLKNSMAWSSNPKIYDEYTYMLDRFSQYFTLFVHYTHTGKWTNDEYESSWGAKDHTGQPLAEAHKYRALVNWVNAHP